MKSRKKMKKFRNVGLRYFHCISVQKQCRLTGESYWLMQPSHYSTTTVLYTCLCLNVRYLDFHLLADKQVFWHDILVLIILSRQQETICDPLVKPWGEGWTLVRPCMGIKVNKNSVKIRNSRLKQDWRPKTLQMGLGHHHSYVYLYAKTFPAGGW